MNTSSAEFQILVALGSAIFGAALSWAISGRGGRGGHQVDLRGARIEDSDVRVGDTHLTVNTDNRIFISLNDARTIASSTEDDAEEQRLTRQRRREEEEHERRLRDIRNAGKTEPDSEWADILLQVGGFLIAVAIVITGYLRFREDVVTTITLVATSALFVVFGALLSLLINRVRLDWKLNFQLVTNLVLGSATVWSLRWLNSPPPFTDDPEAFRQLIETAPTITVADLLSEEQRPGLVVVAYQILGLVALTASIFFIVLHSVKVLAVIGLAVRVRRDPAYAAGPIRSLLIRVVGAPAGLWWVSTLLGLFSLLLMTGLLASWVNAQDFSGLANL